MRDGSGIDAEFDLEGTVKNATELLEILDENSSVMNQPFSDLTLEFYKMTHNTDIVMEPPPDEEKVPECTENQETSHSGDDVYELTQDTDIISSEPAPAQDEMSTFAEDPKTPEELARGDVVGDSEDSDDDLIIESGITTSEPTPAQDEMSPCAEDPKTPEELARGDVISVMRKEDDSEDSDDNFYELTSETTPDQDEKSIFGEDPKTPEELARRDVFGDSDDDLIIEYCKITSNPDIVILEPSPAQEKVPECTENQETSQRNLADLLREEVHSEDSDDSLATIWNSCIAPNSEELPENFEEGPVIFSVSELKEMPKRGQMIRDLDISKVDTLSDTCSIKDIFNPTESLNPRFIATSFEPDAVLVVNGNHRMAALSKRYLTDSEKSMKVECTVVIVPRRVFEVAWNYSKSLQYSGLTSSSDLDRINLPQSIIEVCIRFTPGDVLRQECAFTLKNQIHAYMIYFEKMFSEVKRKEMRHNAKRRNRERKQLLEWDVRTNDSTRNTQKDLFLIFCMPELSKKVTIEWLKSGLKFPTGSHFVQRLFSYAIKNDETTSRELQYERFNPNPRKVEEFLRTLKRMVLDDGTLKGKATNGRFSEFGVKISSIEEATSNGFVVFDHKIPNIDYMNARNLNAFVVSPSGDNKAVQGKYQSGVFKDDTGRVKPFEISGHLVRNDIKKATKKKVFNSIASAINGYCQLKNIRVDCVCPIYHLEQSDTIVTID